MPVDIALIKTVLRALANNAGRSNVTEEIVAIDCEAMLRRPMIAHQIRDALMESKRQGWAVDMTDDFGMPVWSILKVGEEKLRTL